MRLNLSSGDARNCKETTFIKERILNSAYKQELLFEKSKETEKFRGSKTPKSTRTASKTWGGNEF